MKEQKKFGISGSTLKLIAIITMLIDHIGAAIVENVFLVYDSSEKWKMWYGIDRVMRLTGRIAFPIFCFLLVEGLLHTRSVKKYAGRLFLFALLSEIPFDLMLSLQPFRWQHQNVFFTLLLSLLVMEAFQKAEENNDWKNRVFGILFLFGGVFLGEALHTDYGGFGVTFPVLLYVFRKNNWIRDILGAFCISWEITAPFAFIPIHLYNGKRGWNIKYAFYIFYPAHLLILWILESFFLKRFG